MEKVEFKCIVVGFMTRNLPVSVGEIKGMKNLTVIEVQFGSFNIKVLKLCWRRRAGGGSNDNEDGEEKEKRRDQLFKEHGLKFFGVQKMRMGPLNESKGKDLGYI